MDTSCTFLILEQTILSTTDAAVWLCITVCNIHTIGLEGRN